MRHLNAMFPHANLMGADASTASNAAAAATSTSGAAASDIEVLSLLQTMLKVVQVFGKQPPAAEDGTTTQLVLTSFIGTAARQMGIWRMQLPVPARSSSGSDSGSEGGSSNGSGSSSGGGSGSSSSGNGHGGDSGKQPQECTANDYAAAAPWASLLGRCLLVAGDRLAQVEVHLSDGEGGVAALRSLAGRSRELASSFGELERCCKVLETELLRKLRLSGGPAAVADAEGGGELLMQQLADLAGSLKSLEGKMEGFGDVALYDAGKVGVLTREVKEAGEKLREVGMAVCAQAPLRAYCNNPRCRNLTLLSEMQLVKMGSSQCSGCKVAGYCGRACQKAHWKEHKAVCQRLQAGGKSATAAAGSAAAAAGMN